MEKTTRVTFSMAILVLVCFFLPWIQLSCAGHRESESGFDLARGGKGALWLIPISMVVVVIILFQILKSNAFVKALISSACGLICALLMNRERVDAEQASGLIQAHVTGWFWLGLASSLGLVISALIFLIRKPRSP